VHVLPAHFPGAGAPAGPDIRLDSRSGILAPGRAARLYSVMLRKWAATGLRAAIFLAFYLGTIGLLHGHGFFRQAVLWLPTGVAVSGLWLLGSRYWPVILLGTLIHRLAAGYMFPTYLPALLGNVLEALVAVALLRRMGFRREMRRLQDGLALLAVAAVAPIVSATIGRTNYFVRQDEFSFFDGWTGWWRMNALGVLVVVPLVLSWMTPPWQRPRLRTLLEVLALTSLVIGVTWFLISIESPTNDSGIVLSYLALPVTMYAAVRFGVRGAATAAAGVVILLTLGTANGFGLFVIPATAASPAAARELALQAVIAIVTATPLLLGAVIAEREAALARVVVERERHQELLASINHNVSDGLFRVSMEQGMVYSNTALARMLGYDSPEQLLGTRFGDLFADPADHRVVNDRLQALGHIVNEESRFVRRDGTFLPTLVSCIVVHGPDGRPAHCDGAVSDITARKRLEDQLRQTQKLEALGKLAGGVAHDFNNLLTVIGGHAELLQLALRENVTACTHAREVTAATARAAGLTRQLLAYSRRQVLEPQVLDLGQAVAQLSDMLRRLIGEDIQLVTQQSPERLFVRVDRGQIEQVIINLAINARDAMPTGGTLILGTTPIEAQEVVALGHAGVDLPAGPLVCLSVKDTGVGMDATVMSQAFDPFFTTKGPGKGTGLGLSTVYGIVRQSEGIVWFESAPHAGTTARVCLPRVAQPADQPADTPTPLATIAASGTVLVVEDEPQVRELISRTLEDAGFTVLVAEDGRQGLELARRTTSPLDLVVTDAVMPHMGGRELIAHLTAERPGLRALLVSGYAGAAPDPADPRGAAIAFLAKPFTPSALADRVRACIATRQAESARADRPRA
jgi:PAS domain S-box-containing protein